MKRKYESNFEYGKNMSKYTIIGAVIACLASMLLFGSNPTLQVISMGLAIILMIATAVYIYKNCICPYCGKHIMFGVLVVKECPRCHRNLTTGKKVKKVKKK